MKIWSIFEWMPEMKLKSQIKQGALNIWSKVESVFSNLENIKI